jgi:IS1 family transposase
VSLCRENEKSKKWIWHLWEVLKGEKRRDKIRNWIPGESGIKTFADAVRQLKNHDVPCETNRWKNIIKNIRTEI